MGLNLAQPLSEIAIAKFGGLYTEADTRGLPEGASARNHDIDFIIGGIGPRPGLTQATDLSVGPGMLVPYVQSSILAYFGPSTLTEANRNLWVEKLTAPGVFTSFYPTTGPGILNNAVAISENVTDTEFIALSDFRIGTDQPKTYNGSYLGRVSQVAPGYSPGVSGSTPLTVATLSRTAGVVDVVLDGSDPHLFSVGELVTINGVQNPSTMVDDPSFDGIFPVASVTDSLHFSYFNNSLVVQCTSMTRSGGTVTAVLPSTVVSLGTADIVVRNGTDPSFDGRFTPTGGTLFTIEWAQAGPNAAVTGGLIYQNASTGGLSGTGRTYLSVVENATVDALGECSGTATGVTIYGYPYSTYYVPFLQPNLPIFIHGGTLVPSGNYIIDGGSTPPDANFRFASGAPPGGPATINVEILIPDTTATGGTISSGIAGGLAPGQRYAVVMFQMKDDYITPASNPTAFITSTLDSGLTFTGIHTGPPGVVARIIALTLANSGIGGPYYYVPNVVTDSNGNTFGPTVIQDNTSTTLVDVALNDQVIAAGINISVVGNNHFQMREIGEYVKGIQFSGRMAYMGERIKVDNFINMTFDGGGVDVNFPEGWTLDPAFDSYVSLIVSPIYGNSLAIKNQGGGVLNPSDSSVPALACVLNQTAVRDVYDVPIIRTNTDYSVRITAWRDVAAGTNARIGLGLFDPDTGNAWLFDSMALTTDAQEFIADLNNPLWTKIPPHLEFILYPLDVNAGGTVFIDRIEPYPTLTPVYSSQIAFSYEANPQSVDSQTGIVDIALLTNDPITNEYLFIDSFYVTVRNHTYQIEEVSGSEPSFWGVQEISNTVGCIGPLSQDPGEEYALVADRRGGFVFDGGNHVKFSQEIQQLWESIYWASAYKMWIKNDLHQQRVLIGVPMVTPNIWFPDAPVSATPSTPNVILMCSYLMVQTGAEIAAEVGVHPSSYTGALIGRDAVRKWSIWQIPAPVGSGIQRQDGNEEIWLGSSVGKIYHLDEANFTDDGAPILESYTTYGLSDEGGNAAMQLGSYRKLWAYLTSTILGVGDLEVTTYPETLDSPYAYTQPGFALTPLMLDDLNMPLNETGNYMFLKFSTDGVAGSYFKMYRTVVGITSDHRIPISGKG